MSSGLPSGFVLDDVAPAPKSAAPGLPPGFVLEGDSAPAATQQAQPKPAGGLLNIRMSEILKGMYDAAKSGLALPHDVMAGKVDPTSDEAVKRSFDAVALASPTTPASRFKLGVTPPPANPVAQAADGINVAVPGFIATDNRVVKQMGFGARNMPVGGAKVAGAIDEMKAGLNRAADETAAAMGSGDRFIAGEAAKGGMTDWITKTSRDLTDKAYSAVEDVVNPTVTVPLNATRAKVDEIIAQNTMAGLPGGRAAGFVEEALKRPEGLTYEGIKGLRSRVGEMLSGRLESDISQGELKRLYAGLTDDLANAVKVAGGERGAQLWERANGITRAVKAREEQLRKIVGESAEAAPETVYQRLYSYASDRNGANIQRLAQAKKAMSSGDWEEVASAIVQRMGRDAEGKLTPDRFMTEYGKMSDAAKNMLFGADGAHRNALEQIATISSRYVEDTKKFGNPSGTAQNASLIATGAGLATNPLATIGTVVGGAALGSMLAKPATASSMAKWAATYEAVKKSPTPTAMSALQRSSNNLAATIGDQFGKSFSGSDFMRILQGPRTSPAEDQSRQ